MPKPLEGHVSNSVIDAAGRVLAADNVPAAEYAEAVSVIRRWRAQHARPLARVARELADTTGLEPVQRLKRLDAIHRKIRRVPRFADRLSSMQDIGGCRVVFETAAEARAAFEQIRNGMECGKVTFADHVTAPPASGYRSIHLVCRVEPETGARHERSEIQLRSAAQDAWATAVETAGRLVGEPLKEGRGDSDWLRLFQLMGDYIAAREGTPLRGPSSTVAEMSLEVSDLAGVLDVLRLLEPRQFAVSKVSPFAVSPLGALGMQYVVINSDVSTSRATVSTFAAQNLWEALEAYGKEERSTATSSTAQAVAVGVTNWDSLLARYPAYFGATASFMKLLREAMRGVDDPL